MPPAAAENTGIGWRKRLKRSRLRRDSGYRHDPRIAIIIMYFVVFSTPPASCEDIDIATLSELNGAFQVTVATCCRRSSSPDRYRDVDFNIQRQLLSPAR